VNNYVGGTTVNKKPRLNDSPIKELTLVERAIIKIKTLLPYLTSILLKGRNVC